MAPPPPPPASRQQGALTPATSASASTARPSAPNTSSNSKSRPSSMIIPSQQRQQTPVSSPRPRSSSILSTADSAASTSPSNSSSPRATRSSSSALPSSSSYRNFLGASRSNDRLAPSSPSQQRPYSMAAGGSSSSSSGNAAGLTGHDPHLTPTPSSRKQSLSSSSSMTSLASAASGGSSTSANRGPRLGASDYRYSLGPAPVRFPKEAGGSRRGSGVADAGPALLSASPTASSASAARRQRTPSPRASRSRTTSSNSYLDDSTSASQGVAAEYGEEEEDQEITPRPTRPHSRLALTSTTGATGGGKSDTNTPGNSSLLDIDKRFSTRTSSSATLRGNYSASSGGHDQGAAFGSSAASSSSTHLQRPGMPPRPSSKVLTTFPFPHPTTPRGTTDEEGRTLPNLLGFSWVSKLFGSSGAGGQDKEGGEAAAAATRLLEQQEGERRGLLTSQQDQQQAQTSSGPSPRTSRAAPNYGAVPSPSPRPRSDYQQRGGQSASATVASQQPRRNPSLSSLTTSEPDPSDPYGYRRLAGPDLLPTYHAEHVNPRRRKRELQRRWEKRRKVWMAVGAVLLFCGLLFVGAKALDTIRSGGESEEGGDGSGGAGPPAGGEGGPDGGQSGGGEDGGAMGSLIASLPGSDSTRATIEWSSAPIPISWEPSDDAH